uniref:Uncharacterized protein n=1 Tax=Glossina austeni TaxID=7395 RepID=A0A1A9V7F2_GLOAU
MTTTLRFNAHNPMNYFMSWLWKIFLLSHVILLMTALISIQIHYVTANAMGGNVATSANSANNGREYVKFVIPFETKNMQKYETSPSIHAPIQGKAPTDFHAIILWYSLS